MDQNTSCEAMDIDLSNNSVREMDISYNNTSTDEVTFEYSKSPKKIVIHEESNVKNLKPNIQRSKNKFKSMFIITSVVTIFFSIIIYHTIDVKCSQVNIEQLENTLTSKLFGQSKAVDTIIKTLEANVENKILFFYGSTGVGKTYTASIIMENAGYSSNVYHYTMPSFVNTFSTELMVGFTICKTSIIVIDDLSYSDMGVKTHIKDIILKSENLDKNITIILIYNCDNIAGGFGKICDDIIYTKSLENYVNVKALKKVIKFETLTEEHLKRCIENELEGNNLNNYDIDKILKTFNVSLDGCKGVHKKMKLLNIV